MITIENKSSELKIITVQGELDAEVAVEVKDQFEDIAQDGTDNVVMDLTETEFLDSSGIGAIVFLFKRLNAQGRSLHLHGLTGQPKELIEMLRIDKAIPVSQRLDRIAS